MLPPSDAESTLRTNGNGARTKLVTAILSAISSCVPWRTHAGATGAMPPCQGLIRRMMAPRLQWALGRLVVIFLLICSARAADPLVYVGTDTGSGSKGIYAFRLQMKSGKLAPLG